MPVPIAGLRFVASDDGSIQSTVRKVNGYLQSFKDNANKAAKAVTENFGGVTTAVTAVAAAFSIREAIEFADQVTKTSKQTGIMVEQVQRLMFVADQADVDVAALTTGVGKLQRVLQGAEEGNVAFTEALGKLHITSGEFFQLKPDEQFEKVAIAISNIDDASERAARTADLFGRGGAELLPVMEALAKESAALEKSFVQIGGPVGKEAIEQVDQLGDEANALWQAAKNATVEFLAWGSPPVIGAINLAKTSIGALRYQMGAGTNPSANIDRKIEELTRQMQRELALAGRAGARADEVRAAITARFEEQIKTLKFDQEALHDTGLGGLALRNPIKVALEDPSAGLGFQETDDARQKRLKAEEQQRLDRIQHLATIHQIEQDMEAKNQIKLAEIDQKALDDGVARATSAAGRRLQIESDLQSFMAGVRELFGLQEIKFEEIKNQSILEIALQAFSVLAKENSKLAKIQQGIALAQTIWSTAAGVMKAFETLPWPANLVAAAKVALTGAIQVAKIKSTNYSAGSVSGTAASLGGGGGVSAAAPQAPQVPDLPTARGATNIYVSGFITKEITDYIVASIREAVDRDVVLIPQNSRQAEIIRGT